MDIKNRLKELDKSRNDLISLITSNGCDEDQQDAEFERIFSEEKILKEELDEINAKLQLSADTQDKINTAMEMIEQEKFELEVFDNILIRKLIECVKVMSKNEIVIIFKGGVEVRAEVEE